MASVILILIIIAILTRDDHFDDDDDDDHHNQDQVCSILWGQLAKKKACLRTQFSPSSPSSLLSPLSLSS